MPRTSNRDDRVSSETGSNLFSDIGSFVSDNPEGERGATRFSEFGEKKIERACKDLSWHERLLESEEFTSGGKNRDCGLSEHLNLPNAQ